jgi:hypothetical protein
MVNFDFVKQTKDAITEDEICALVPALKELMFSDESNERNLGLLLSKMAFRISEQRAALDRFLVAEETGLRHVSAYLPLTYVNGAPAAFPSPLPWSITQKPYRIVDANGNRVADLTTLDKANAELIVHRVNLNPSDLLSRAASLCEKAPSRSYAERVTLNNVARHIRALSTSQEPQHA